MKLTVRYKKRNGDVSVWKIDAESRQSAERCFRMEHPTLKILSIEDGFTEINNIKGENN